MGVNVHTATSKMHDVLSINTTKVASVYLQENIGHGISCSIELTSNISHDQFPFNPFPWYYVADLTIPIIQDIFKCTSIGIRLLSNHNENDFQADLCRVITNGILNRTYASACDGYYDKAETCVGTTTFTVHVTQNNDDPLIGGI